MGLHLHHLEGFTLGTTFVASFEITCYALQHILRFFIASVCKFSGKKSSTLTSYSHDAAPLPENANHLIFGDLVGKCFSTH